MADVPVAALCRILKISRSGYYAWRDCPESAHAQQDRQLRVRVRALFEASRKRYGGPRVWEDLKEEQIRVGRREDETTELNLPATPREPSLHRVSDSVGPHHPNQFRTVSGGRPPGGTTHHTDQSARAQDGRQLSNSRRPFNCFPWSIATASTPP